MKAGFVVNLLTCGMLCLAAAPAVSQQIRIHAALPPEFLIDFARLNAALPGGAKIVIQRESAAAAVVEQVLQGNIDIAIVPTNSVTRVAPAFAVYDLPFAVSDDYYRLFSGYSLRQLDIASDLDESLKKVGLGLIDKTLYGNTFVIAIRKPARSPSDFRGIRIGLPPDSTIRETLKLAGAIPVAVTDRRSIIDALLKKEIDAVEWPLDDLPNIAMGFTHARYVAMTHHRFSGIAIVYNRSNYARLSSDERKRVEKAFEQNRNGVPDVDVPYGFTKLEINENIQSEWRHLVEKTHWKTISKIDNELLSTLQIPDVPLPAPNVTQAWLDDYEPRLREAIKDSDLKLERRENALVVIAPIDSSFDPKRPAMLLPATLGPFTRVAKVLEVDPKTAVLVLGHSDTSGAAPANVKLSQERAQSVAAIFRLSGLQRDRLMLRGMGGDAPRAANDSVEGRTLNRRVELIVTPQNTMVALLSKYNMPAPAPPPAPVHVHPPASEAEFFRPRGALGWNTWFQSGSQTTSKQLIKDRDYEIILDLGRDKYPGALSAAVTKLVLKEIEQSPADSDISLLVRPIISGDTLMARPDQPLVAKILRIERRKLAAQDNDGQVIQRAKVENLPLREISQALSVGEPLKWPVVALRTGCAQIAFSIWSVSGLRPLDQIIVNVPVVAADRPMVPDCTAAISGGIETFLSMDTLSNPTQADAALHFFDTGNKRVDVAKTVAVFVDRSELETAIGNGQSPPVYAWTLKSELSQFLGQPDNLQRSIANAHDAIKKPRPYDTVVRQLSAAIFNTRDRSEDAAASHAKASLKKLANRAEPPIVITRYFDRDGSMQYLPLALLAADASERVLSRRLTLVQPLQNTRALSNDACVDNWDFAIPDTLEGAHAETAELLAKTDWRPTGPNINWYHDNLELLSFLKERGDEKSLSTGLLMLAHHRNGSITYSKDGNPDRILSSEVQREFAHGSFAVLAACATSGTSQESQDFIQHLLHNGVDAAITSPFLVDATFGTRFAVSFATVTKTARQNGEPARLVDLFNRAIDLTRHAYRDQQGYSDMALEFQIVGNHQVRLCSRASAGH